MNMMGQCVPIQNGTSNIASANLQDIQTKMQSMTDGFVSKGDPMTSAPHPRPAAFEGNSAPLVDFITESLDDSKSEEIVIIDLEGKTAIADAMVIASGRSRRHVGAIADKLVKQLKEKGHRGLKVEGQGVGEWVLIDAGDVIVHVFQPEIRDFYNLEKMWSGERPEISSI